MPVAVIKKCPIYRALTGYLFVQYSSGLNLNLCPVGVRITGHFCVQEQIANLLSNPRHD